MKDKIMQHGSVIFCFVKPYLYINSVKLVNFDSISYLYQRIVLTACLKSLLKCSK